MDLPAPGGPLNKIEWPPAAATSRARLAGAWPCLLYTSDAADERSSVDLGGRRIIKKKKTPSLCSITSTVQITAYHTHQQVIEEQQSQNIVQ